MVDETIALFHRLRWVAEQIYGPLTARRLLAPSLGQTVPTLARARGVTRQNVQPVVDQLVREGLATLEDNPEHALSRLVCITSAGAALVTEMDDVDAHVLELVGAGLAKLPLEALRERFESRWRVASEGARRAAGVR
ncbi:MAG: winged helix-turn-helix transcriptional regulator [Polyangiaceae bacterium]|nr:winged helix-turn-helix transcriptional regulator [Polyangiaceae bacterium]